MNDNDILVRIAVGIADDGSWVAVGDGKSSDDEKVGFLRQLAPITVSNVYWVEARVPSVEIVGEMVTDPESELEIS